MTRAQLIQDVKYKIDELVPENELTLAISANSSINTISETIDAFINECAIQVLKEAPLHLCPLGNASTIPVIVSNNVGTITMPMDFMRFGSVKFGVWKRTVYKHIEYGSREYEIQQNEYVRGGYSKPQVALRREAGGLYYIECYTITEADKNTGRVVFYVAEPSTGETITADNNIIKTPYAWLIASKVLQTFKLYDAAKAAFEQYTNTLK